MKTVGIYDRWLHTLGGGERHAVSLAQTLTRLGFKVEVLTHRYTDLDQLKTKFGFSKINFKVKYLPELWDYELTPYTKKYDLFILSSFADIFSSKAKYSILSVFFPTKLKLSFKDFLIRVVTVPIFRKLFLFLIYIQKEKNQVITATNKKQSKIKLQLQFQKLAISTIEQLEVKSLHTQVTKEIQVDHYHNIVNLTIFAQKPIRQWIVELPDNEYSKEFTLKLKNNFWNKFGYFLMNLNKKYSERFKAGPRKFNKQELKSYNLILANSNFTQKWIKKYWQLNSEVLYPPVNTKLFSIASNQANKKKKWIVSIGRFFVGGHSKNQLELVKAFKQFHQKHKDWQLHLVGSVNEAQVHQDYYNQVVQEANHLPVKIHKNISFKELKKILTYSSIYWHASGLSIDEQKYPVMLEHFGLTVIEAMASGCVPIVVNKGGPIEIVKGVGFTWNTIPELVVVTSKIIKSGKLHQYSLKARQKARDFDNKVFIQNLRKIIKTMKI